MTESREGSTRDEGEGEAVQEQELGELDSKLDIILHISLCSRPTFEPFGHSCSLLSWQRKCLGY